MGNITTGPKESICGPRFQVKSAPASPAGSRYDTLPNQHQFPRYSSYKSGFSYGTILLMWAYRACPRSPTRLTTQIRCTAAQVPPHFTTFSCTHVAASYRLASQCSMTSRVTKSTYMTTLVPSTCTHSHLPCHYNAKHSRKL